MPGTIRTKEQRNRETRARTERRIADLKAQGKHVEASKLEKRSAAARKNTKRLGEAVSKAQTERWAKGRAMTAEEKILKNSRFPGDSNTPRGKFDHAEREGLRPKYSGEASSESAPEFAKAAADAVLHSLRQIMLAESGPDAHGWAKAATEAAKVSGPLPATVPAHSAIAIPNPREGAFSMPVATDEGTEFPDECVN